jgi:hypothetical protein
MICEHCGNDDPERMLALLKEYWVGGRLVGQILKGYRCERCGEMLPPMVIGKPADRATSGAH